MTLNLVRTSKNKMADLNSAISLTLFILTFAGIVTNIAVGSHNLHGVKNSRSLGETCSDWFSIQAGVRQGGILSPIFYCVYVDEIIEILSAAGIGCHVRDLFLSILLYADDMCLVAPSLRGLQKLLHLVESYCHDWDILLNPKKSKNMQFGKKLTNLPSLILDGKSLEWVDKWAYLGVTLHLHKNFNCCIAKKLKFLPQRKFHSQSRRPFE